MYDRILKEMLGVYEADQDLSPEVQALVMELVPIQKRIKSLEARLAELKDDKKELSGPVIAAMQQLDLQNVRIGKILVSFVKGGMTPPSYKAVMDAVRTQLAPAVSKLLDDTYASIGTEKEPYLKIKTESVDEGAWQGIKDFFSRGFEQLVGAVSGALGSIEGMLGITEAKRPKAPCPKCGEETWDTSNPDQRLNKCWNCGTRFDNPDMDEDYDSRQRTMRRPVKYSSVYVYYPYGRDDVSGQIRRIAKRFGLHEEGSGVEVGAGKADISFGPVAGKDMASVVRAFKSVEGVEDVELQERRTNEGGLRSPRIPLGHEPRVWKRTVMPQATTVDGVDNVIRKDPKGGYELLTRGTYSTGQPVTLYDTVKTPDGSVGHISKIYLYPDKGSAMYVVDYGASTNPYHQPKDFEFIRTRKESDDDIEKAGGN